MTILLCVIIPYNVLAHSPSNASVILSEGKNGQWTLQLRASLTAFQTIVHDEFGEKSYKTADEFKDLVFQLLKDNQELYLDNKIITLKNQKVKLGHETIVLYQVNMPNSLNTISYKNDVFKNIYKSKMAFLVLKNDVKKELFYLNKDNNYSINLQLNNNQFNEIVNDTSTTKFSANTYLIAIIIFVIVSFGIVIRLVSRSTN
ncbi:hypothetical protein [Neotamlana laminarinivorans]|uniref:Transmembrane protein n=1 Tax=Neotamlana laminarinivorans TaxID=2883124 RepID=A0A9X1L0F3_9FLAO|nr:hypothetical protein [Tamlana laminarinivorans]MCB4797728.1 hypothetical protein [Tamlana laminarinivorans]